MIGDKIKMLRKSQGLTQAQFAQKLFVTPAAVSQWEKNATRPDTERLMSIAKTFAVPLDFFSDEDKEYTEAELIKKHILIELNASQPKTSEARIISGGVDKMPQAAREKALRMMQVVFAEYADYFKNAERKDDNADDDDR